MLQVLHLNQIAGTGASANLDSFVRIFSYFLCSTNPLSKVYTWGVAQLLRMWGLMTALVLQKILILPEGTSSLPVMKKQQGLPRAHIHEHTVYKSMSEATSIRKEKNVLFYCY